MQSVRQEIDTVEQAIAAGMAGSPTLLIDRHDPFAAAGQEPSLSCRLYRGEDGQLDHAPSVAQLRRIIEVHQNDM